MSNTNKKLDLRDLVRNPSTGKLSLDRVWKNVGYFVATVLFVKIGWAGELSYEIWITYLGLVGGFAAISKAQDLKQRVKQYSEGDSQ